MPCSSMIRGVREAQQASCTGSVHLSISLSALPSPKVKAVALRLFGRQSCRRTNGESRGRKVTSAPPPRPPACLPAWRRLHLEAVSASPAETGATAVRRKHNTRETRTAHAHIGSTAPWRLPGIAISFSQTGSPSLRYQMFLIEAGNEPKIKGPRFLLYQQSKVGTS